MRTTFLQKGSKKLVLSSYPYTFVRVTVMRTLLLKKDDYNRLLKMDIPEIAKFLQETEYKKGIDIFASDYEGAELIEFALDNNLTTTFEKLKNISQDDLREAVSEYLLRKDVFNIKTVLRGKLARADKKEIMDLIVPVGYLSRKDFEHFLDIEVVDILKSMKVVPYEIVEAAYKTFEQEHHLIDIENALDQWYYKRMLTFMQRIEGRATFFKRFLFKEIEVRNLLTLLRLKKENMNLDNIRKYLFLFKGKTSEERKHNMELEKLIAVDLEKIDKTILDKKFAAALRKGAQHFMQTRSLLEMEKEMQKYLLDFSGLLQHQHPLSVDVILGYMLAKEIEVKNIKTVAKCKLLGFDEQFIASQIVV
ncbi:V-type ATPase subunit [Candidatus Woesearchaeota archaeon]|nr:V-type ATPase subunit [Candidatus Woesearchaeota archaeon]